MVTTPRTTIKSLSDEETRAYLEAVENGAPGNKEAVFKAWAEGLTLEEADAWSKSIQEMREQDPNW